MKVLFLDIDGVLNSEQFHMKSGIIKWTGAYDMEFGSKHMDPEAIKHLNSVIEATDAKIVISSTWRRMWKLGQIATMLKMRGFKHSSAIIDKTPGMDSKPRGEEVREWLSLERERRVLSPERMPIVSYAIVDDDGDFLPDQRDHFVQTNPRVGLTTQDATRLIQILNSVGT